MKPFKVVRITCKPAPKRTMSSNGKAQTNAKPSTIVTRSRTVSTASATTIVAGSGSDSEGSQKKPRKTPTKAKDQARNGGRKWTPAQRAFLWKKRHTMRPEDGKPTFHNDIGKQIGKTAQACRIEFLHMRDRKDYGGLEYAIHSSFEHKRYNKKKPQGESRPKAKTQARRKAATTKTARAPSTVSQLPLPSSAASSLLTSVEQESDDEAIVADNETIADDGTVVDDEAIADDETIAVDETVSPTSSRGSAAQFRTPSGDRLAVEPTPAPLMDDTSEPSSHGVQTRAQSRAQWGSMMQGSYFREPEVEADSLSSTPDGTHTNAELDAANILGRMRNATL